MTRVPRPVLLAGIVGGLLLVGLGAWFTLLQPPPPPTGTTASSGLARVGAAAPPVVLPLTNGGLADLSQDRGKVVLLNFWATWCDPCRAEMPGLQRLADDLSGVPFAFYPVNLQEDPPTIEPFLRDLGLHTPVLLDEEGDVTRAFGVRALPATFLVDQAGVLRQQRLGPLVDGGENTPWSRDWLAKQVRSLLASG